MFIYSAFNNFMAEYYFLMKIKRWLDLFKYDLTTLLKTACNLVKTLLK